MIKAGRIGVDPNEVDHYGRIKLNGYSKPKSKLPAEVLDATTGTLTRSYINVGLAYNDFLNSPEPYVACIVDETETSIYPLQVININPDALNEPTGRIIYLGFRNGNTAPIFLIMDTSVEDDTYTTTWHWQE